MNHSSFLDYYTEYVNGRSCRLLCAYRFPLLTLHDFFEGNTAEDSITPNDCNFGRPPIAEIWELLQNLEKMPCVAWIRIELHRDTEITEYDGKDVLVLADRLSLMWKSCG